MLLVDDLLLAPFKGILWIFEEVHKAARDEQDAEEGSILQRLSELYLKVEAGAITEEVFAEQEKQLLDRLDAIRETEEGE